MFKENVFHIYVDTIGYSSLHLQTDFYQVCNLWCRQSITELEFLKSLWGLGTDEE
jgi:hypothetical protein